MVRPAYVTTIWVRFGATVEHLLNAVGGGFPSLRAECTRQLKGRALQPSPSSCTHGRSLYSLHRLEFSDGVSRTTSRVYLNIKRRGFMIFEYHTVILYFRTCPYQY